MYAERLVQHAVCSYFLRESFDPKRGDRAVATHDDHAGFGSERTHFANDGRAVQARHAHVSYDQIKVLLLETIQALLAVARDGESP